MKTIKIDVQMRQIGERAMEEGLEEFRQRHLALFKQEQAEKKRRETESEGSRGKTLTQRTEA